LSIISAVSLKEYDLLTVIFKPIATAIWQFAGNRANKSSQRLTRQNALRSAANERAR